LCATRHEQACGKEQTVATAVATTDVNKAEDPSSPPEATSSNGGRRRLILFAAPVALAVAVGSGLWLTGILPRLLGLGHGPDKTESSLRSPNRRTWSA
jgi:hypothetical protein